MPPRALGRLVEMMAMVGIKADNEGDIKAAENRGEEIGLFEPLVLGEGSLNRPKLTDLALELAQRSAGFRRSLPCGLLFAQ